MLLEFTYLYTESIVYKSLGTGNFYQESIELKCIAQKYELEERASNQDVPECLNLTFVEPIFPISS